MCAAALAMILFLLLISIGLIYLGWISMGIPGLIVGGCISAIMWIKVLNSNHKEENEN
jgi:hypothetical protein